MQQFNIVFSFIPGFDQVVKRGFEVKGIKSPWAFEAERYSLKPTTNEHLG